jgi:hypothetical protein
VRVARLSRKEIRIKPLKFLTSHAECGQAPMAPYGTPVKLKQEINEHIAYLEARYAADGEAKEGIKLGVVTVRPSVVSSGSQNPRSGLREPHWRP